MVYEFKYELWILIQCGPLQVNSECAVHYGGSDEESTGHRVRRTETQQIHVHRGSRSVADNSWIVFVFLPTFCVMELSYLMPLLVRIILKYMYCLLKIECCILFDVYVQWMWMMMLMLMMMMMTYDCFFSDPFSRRGNSPSDIVQYDHQVL